MMNLLHVTTALLLSGLISASTWSVDHDEHEDRLELARYKRSWKKNKIPVAKCPAGSKAVVTCEVCPTGYYTQKSGFWQDCVPCGEGKTTTPDRPHKCVTECRPGWTWNVKNKKCLKCSGNTAKPDSGNHACTPCPKYFKPSNLFTECGRLECPAGYEPRTLLDGKMTCAPCRLGYFKRNVGGSKDFCEKCRKDKWTLTTGTTLMERCLGKIPDTQCEAAYGNLVAALESVAYDMTENDTLGDKVCEQDANIKDLIRSVMQCKDVVHAVSGEPFLPVYVDETKTISMIEILNNLPPCFITVVSLGSSEWWSSWSSSMWWSSSSFWWSSSSHWWSNSHIWSWSGSSSSGSFILPGRPFSGFLSEYSGRSTSFRPQDEPLFGSGDFWLWARDQKTDGFASGNVAMLGSGGSGSEMVRDMSSSSLELLPGSGTANEPTSTTTKAPFNPGLLQRGLFGPDSDTGSGNEAN